MLERRIKSLRARMTDADLDALLVSDISNVFYLTGFTGSTAAAVVTSKACYVLVDPRYTVQARSECTSSTVNEYVGKSTISAVSELLNDLAPQRLGYEADQLTVSTYRELRSRTNSATSFRSTRGLVEELRRVKDAGEIALIKHACGIADAAFASIVREIAIGMSEKDVALLVDSTLRRLGADKEAFETIAASGPRAACPHASPTDAILETGMLLKLDFGARYRHYNSDITRTICLGKPSSKQKEIYGIVLDAQLRAIDAVAPGKPGKDIDAVARDYIASKGYGDNFGHGLGHALGILVHDGPAFSRTSDAILEPGMIVTVEPGIYIEGWGGVRIEDDVLVTDSGAEILTHATKELLSI
jgi:Xaa-Pro aminopeptidase